MPIAPRSVRFARAAMIGSLLGYTAYFHHRYDLSPDHKGGASLWLLTWMTTSTILIIAHLPAWFLVRRLATNPEHRTGWYLWAILPLAAIAIFGVYVQGTDWDELVLFLIPTLPSILAVSILTASTRPQ